MKEYTENCMVCAQPLVYFESSQNIRCYVCGTENETNAVCKDLHYVCDNCHSEKGLLIITFYANETLNQNPIKIATEIMKNQAINMHGPEHHYLIVASLLAAYKNAGGKIELSAALRLARQRAQKLPGGICGLWGSCGAGIATGIFFSIITKATPLSEKEWSLANHMTSRSLNIIAENGGPRCCKRNSYLAILQAAAFVKEQFGITTELQKKILCEFSHRNEQCKKTKCLFYINPSPKY